MEQVAGQQLGRLELVLGVAARHERQAFLRHLVCARELPAQLVQRGEREQDRHERLVVGQPRGARARLQEGRLGLGRRPAAGGDARLAQRRQQLDLGPQPPGALRQPPRGLECRLEVADALRVGVAREGPLGGEPEEDARRARDRGRRRSDTPARSRGRRRGCRRRRPGGSRRGRAGPPAPRRGSARRGPRGAGRAGSRAPRCGARSAACRGRARRSASPPRPPDARARRRASRPRTSGPRRSRPGARRRRPRRAGRAGPPGARAASAARRPRAPPDRARARRSRPSRRARPRPASARAGWS